LLKQPAVRLDWRTINILTVIGSYSALTGMQMSDSDPLKKNLDHIMTATDKAANLTRSPKRATEKGKGDAGPVVSFRA